MTRRVPPELNDPNAKILVAGRDPGSNEVRIGRPFVGKAGQVFDDCLTEAGIRRRDINITNLADVQPKGNAFAAHKRADVERGIRNLHDLIDELEPNLVVALGNEASAALVPEMRTREDVVDAVYNAKGIEERRGYIWRGVHGVKVLTTIHPAAAARQWVPWRVLLGFDFQRAKENANDKRIRRPQREVEVVTRRRDARRAVEELRDHERLASDIEIRDERTLACIGFAGRANRATVFPAAFLDECRPLLEDDRTELIWQNGAFDLHFLSEFCDVRVLGRPDDTMIAWHSSYLELAGKKIGGSGAKRTHKSLAFFASLFTKDAWWKNYEFSDDHEMFVLNGRDCAITYDVFVNHLEPLTRQLGVHDSYVRKTRLVWPVVDMLARGLRVDNELREDRIDALEGRLETLHERANELVVPLIEARSDRIEDSMHLFEKIEGVCDCCRHAKNKQKRCWSCAGFEKAPSKKMLVAAGGDPSKLKAELEEEMLSVCEVCEGKAREEWIEFNEASTTQKRLVLYDLLRLPKRYNGGSLTADEDSLKNLLAYCQ